MFHPFQVEQFLSENEQNITFNFSESGVHPLTLGELLRIAGVDIEDLCATPLNYPNVAGDAVLRQRISAIYKNADPENILVTVGASEANHLVASTLLNEGDALVAMLPTYQQLPGNALNRGVNVKTVALVENNHWQLDLEELDQCVDQHTKIIAVVNPNNPTGHIFTDQEMTAIITAAEQVGAWIVADEVYAGTERDGYAPARPFWGAYDRVISINGMSKAYGLPGLRLGWVAAPKELVPALWRRHEYATISASMLANELAKAALDPPVRTRLMERSRDLIHTGFDALERGLAVHPNVFSVVPPQASAMSFIRYDLPVNSINLVRRLIAEKDLLVIPGVCFGLDHHFRFSSALPEAYVEEGLSRLNALVEDILVSTVIPSRNAG